MSITPEALLEQKVWSRVFCLRFRKQCRNIHSRDRQGGNSLRWSNGSNEQRFVVMWNLYNVVMLRKERSLDDKENKRMFLYATLLNILLLPLTWRMENFFFENIRRFCKEAFRIDNIIYLQSRCSISNVCV